MKEKTVTVKVWTVGELLEEARLQGGDDPTYFLTVRVLGERAHNRGDGVAVYVNQELGNPELGQWQVVTYGGPEAQLETRAPQAPSLETLPLGARRFSHGDDVIPTTLPDIGGRINWRFSLEAICPSYQQRERGEARIEIQPDGKLQAFNADGEQTLRDGVQIADRAFNDPTVDCCGRDAADCDCEDTITVRVDRSAATRMAELWEGNDGQGQEGYAELVRTVRELFAGQDGFLHILNDALGREH